MVITEIKDYLSSNIFRPFLAYVDTIKYQLGILDEEYRGKDLPLFTVKDLSEKK